MRLFNKAIQNLFDDAEGYCIMFTPILAVLNDSYSAFCDYAILWGALDLLRGW